MVNFICVFCLQTLCAEPAGPPANMQISEAAGGVPQPGTEPCRFPKLEECAHFHYERVQLPPALQVALQTSMDQSLHSQHSEFWVWTVFFVKFAKLVFLSGKLSLVAKEHDKFQLPICAKKNGVGL